MESYTVCCFFRRKFKVIEADMDSYVMEAFENYTDGGIRMNVDQLRLFLGDAVLNSEAERILEEILRRRDVITPSLSNRKVLSFQDFQNYVLGDDQLNHPIRSQVHQDMNLPLSHYFIYTSHNSYLYGNELSDCSDIPIIKGLQRGVRVIELDLWANSSKDDVYVLNGRSLSAPVELVRCLISIKEHAFTTSPYPVIIILEDHLTPDLQSMVAQMVTDIFGEMLFFHKLSKVKELPTPESLKYRILISTKPPKEYLKIEEDLEEDEDEDERTESYSAYKNLISIHTSKPKGGLVNAFKVEMDEVKHFSMSEKEFEKVAEDHQQEIVRFTQKNILRMFPERNRSDSFGYKSLLGWLHGAQMVAFNMHIYDKRLWLMHGMFRANGGCGYVRKPDCLMTCTPNNNVFDHKKLLPVKIALNVKIIRGDGWHLNLKKARYHYPPDLYTKVGIDGALADTIMKKTKVVEDTWAPVWNEEFLFHLTIPEIALLRIEVYENTFSENDELVGQTCLPVSELMPGIHLVSLCDRKGDPLTKARLLTTRKTAFNDTQCVSLKG